MKVSLGLLPSGPDPVGEEHVRANLPSPISEIGAGLARARKLGQNQQMLRAFAIAGFVFTWMRLADRRQERAERAVSVGPSWSARPGDKAGSLSFIFVAERVFLLGSIPQGIVV